MLNDWTHPVKIRDFIMHEIWMNVVGMKLCFYKMILFIGPTNLVNHHQIVITVHFFKVTNNFTGPLFWQKRFQKMQKFCYIQVITLFSKSILKTPNQNQFVDFKSNFSLFSNWTHNFSKSNFPQINTNILTKCDLRKVLFNTFSF